MWPFGSPKHKTLSHAVLAGDLKSVKKMLNQGADPNKCDPDDTAYPIHYALNLGPEMVQVLIDHGADVNIPSARNHATPLAFAEAHGYADVAKVLRQAGARLTTGNEEFTMDPRFRLQIETQIAGLIFMARIQSPGDIEAIVDQVEKGLNYKVPPSMSPQDQEHLRKEIRALIRKKCGE